MKVRILTILLLFILIIYGNSVYASEKNHRISQISELTVVGKKIILHPTSKVKRKYIPDLWSNYTTNKAKAKESKIVDCLPLNDIDKITKVETKELIEIKELLLQKQTVRSVMKHITGFEPPLICTVISQYLYHDFLFPFIPTSTNFHILKSCCPRDRNVMFIQPRSLFLARNEYHLLPLITLHLDDPDEVYTYVRRLTHIFLDLSWINQSNLFQCLNIGGSKKYFLQLPPNVDYLVAKDNAVIKYLHFTTSSIVALKFISLSKFNLTPVYHHLPRDIKLMKFENTQIESLQFQNQTQIERLEFVYSFFDRDTIYWHQLEFPSFVHYLEINIENLNGEINNHNILTGIRNIRNPQAITKFTLELQENVQTRVPITIDFSKFINLKKLSIECNSTIDAIKLAPHLTNVILEFFKFLQLSLAPPNLPKNIHTLAFNETQIESLNFFDDSQISHLIFTGDSFDNNLINWKHVYLPLNGIVEEFVFYIYAAQSVTEFSNLLYKISSIKNLHAVEEFAVKCWLLEDDYDENSFLDIASLFTVFPEVIPFYLQYTSNVIYFQLGKKYLTNNLSFLNLSSVTLLPNHFPRQISTLSFQNVKLDSLQFQAETHISHLIFIHKFDIIYKGDYSWNKIYLPKRVGVLEIQIYDEHWSTRVIFGILNINHLSAVEKLVLSVPCVSTFNFIQSWTLRSKNAVIWINLSPFLNAQTLRLNNGMMWYLQAKNIKLIIPANLPVELNMNINYIDMDFLASSEFYQSCTHLKLIFESSKYIKDDSLFEYPVNLHSLEIDLYDSKAWIILIQLLSDQLQLEELIIHFYGPKSPKYLQCNALLNFSYVSSTVKKFKIYFYDAKNQTVYDKKIQKILQAHVIRPKKFQSTNKSKDIKKKCCIKKNKKAFLK